MTSLHAFAGIAPRPSTARAGEAVVVGGSLAGLMTALNLVRSGVRVTVLERAARPRSGGVTLNLSGDADEIVERRDGSGRRELSLAAVASGGVPGTYGWQTAHGNLLAAVRAEADVSVVHGARVIDVGQDESGAWAITDAGSRFAGDVLIGADGHRSVVRSAVAPDRPHASYAGYAVWTGTAGLDAVPGASRGHDWYAPGTTRTGDVLDVGEITIDGHPRRFMWQWYDRSHDDLLRRSGAVREGMPHHSLVGSEVPDVLRRALLDEAASWPSPWAQIVAASIRSDSIIGSPVAEYVPEHLARGRIALVGDAAHAPSPRTGSGFEAGREDAEELGRLAAGGLRGGRGPRALAAYERARLRAARRLVEGGRRFSRAYAPPGRA